MLMIWSKGAIERKEIDHVNFCGGGRGEALKSSSRNGLDEGWGRASREARGSIKVGVVRGGGVYVGM